MPSSAPSRPGRSNAVVKSAATVITFASFSAAQRSSVASARASRSTAYTWLPRASTWASARVNVPSPAPRSAHVPARRATAPRISSTASDVCTGSGVRHGVVHSMTSPAVPRLDRIIIRIAAAGTVGARLGRPQGSERRPVMKRILVGASAVALAIALSAGSAWAFGLKDVIRMHEYGIPDSLIIIKIQHSGVQFHLNTKALVQMHPVQAREYIDPS